MRILVTGGVGFIGTHLCKALVARGYGVLSFDRRTTDEPAFGVEYITEDIRDKDAVRHSLKGVDGIFHLAGLVSVPDCESNPHESSLTNIMGTLNLLQGLRQQQRQDSPVILVFASSSAVYGHKDQKRPLSEPDIDLNIPRSLYGIQKLASEELIRNYSWQYGFPAVVFRFFNVYGPGQSLQSPYSGVISIFVDAIEKNLPLNLHGDGEQTRDFISVHDVVGACLLAIRLPREKCQGQPMNIGSGSSISITELAKRLMKLSGKELPAHHSPPRPADIRYSHANIERAKGALNWHPKADFDAGLKELFRASAPARPPNF